MIKKNRPTYFVNKIDGQLFSHHFYDIYTIRQTSIKID